MADEKKIAGCGSGPAPDTAETVLEEETTEKPTSGG